jgi:hypothetical protein
MAGEKVRSVFILIAGLLIGAVSFILSQQFAGFGSGCYTLNPLTFLFVLIFILVTYFILRLNKVKHGNLISYLKYFTFGTVLIVIVITIFINSSLYVCGIIGI